jgi:hypothetical protein
MALPAAAWMQPPARVQGDGLRVEGTFARQVPVLLGAVESARPVTRLWLDYRLAAAPGGSVHWEAVALDAQGRSLDVLARGELPAADVHAHVEFALPSPKADAHGVGVSVGVRGQVGFDVRALGMAVD